MPKSSIAQLKLTADCVVDFAFTNALRVTSGFSVVRNITQEYLAEHPDIDNIALKNL